MRSVEMRKKRRLRSVCAPQRWSAGTSIGPKLSFSVRVPAIAAVMLRVNCGQVEQQDFSRVAARKAKRALVRLERIACRQSLAVHGERATRDVHIGPATGAQFGARLLAGVEQAGVNARILVDAHRT